MKVVEYKFNNTLYDFLPVFNTGFGNSTNTIVVNILEEVNAEELYYEYKRFPVPSLNGVIGVTGVKIRYSLEDTALDGATIYEEDMEYWEEEGEFGYYYRCATDLGFDVIYAADGIWYVTDYQYDAAPWFDFLEIIIEYTIPMEITDIDNGDGTTTRTIESNTLPTLMRFGKLWSQDEDYATDRELALLEIIDMNTSNINNMNCMFQYCYNLTKINCNWNTTKVSNMADMFRKCYNLIELDVSNFDTSNVTTLHATFANCEKLQNIDVSNWNTSNVTDMNCIFDGCYQLSTLDVSNWNTGNATDMYALFRQCINLVALGNISNWNTTNVTTMQNMFYNCKSLTELDLSNWDVSNVQSLSAMFNTGTNNNMALTKLNLHNWKPSKCRDMGQLFRCCGNLKYLDISNFVAPSNCHTSGLFDCYGIENVGMLHCNKFTVNLIANNLFGDSTIYVKDTKAYEYEDTNNNGVIQFRDYKEQKIAIELPQPLRKVSDYADKLYWDKEKGKYCIKQWVQKVILDGSEDEGWDINYIYSGVTRQVYIATNINIESILFADGAIVDESHIIHDKYTWRHGHDWGTDNDYIEDEFLINNSTGSVCFFKSSIAEDIVAFTTWLSENPFTIYYVMKEPIIIETDTTEKLHFDTYKDYMKVEFEDEVISPSNMNTVVSMKELSFILTDWSNVKGTSFINSSINNVIVDTFNRKIIFDNERTEWYDSYFEIYFTHLNNVDNKTITMKFNKPVKYCCGLFKDGAWYSDKNSSEFVTEVTYTFSESARQECGTSIFRMQIDEPYTEELICTIEYN